MMRFLLLLLFILHNEVVLPDDGTREILVGGKHPCEGYVKVYHENEWGYVGDKFWSKKTEQVVCKSTFCGEPLENSAVDVPLPDVDGVMLNELECTGEEPHLLECTFPGWGISSYRKKTVKMMECSNQIHLELDGFRCAGAVKYSTIGKEAQGYFCFDNWEQMKKEANQLCMSLGCESSKEIPQNGWMVLQGFTNAKKRFIHCSGTEENLWQCAVKEQHCTTPALVICSGHKRVQLRGNTTNVCSGQLEVEDEHSKWNSAVNITPEPEMWCRQMNCGTNISLSQNDFGTNLTCTDKVEVVLIDKQVSSCYGQVHIKVNEDEPLPVCATSWTFKNSELVCRELNCGKVVSTSAKGKGYGILDNVRCTGEESSLWHCTAKRHDKPFMCSSFAYVVCADSIVVQLVAGPGKCAGRAEIQHEGKWKAVSKKGWTAINSNKVCNFLNCGNATQSENAEIFSQYSQFFMKNTVTCSPDASHISQCITTKLNENEKEPEAVGITCEGHQVLFLDGTRSCTGIIGIEQNSKTYWMSGSKTMWNETLANDTCEQMHCGYAEKMFHVERNKSISKVSVVSNICLHPKTSLFDCENTATLPSDHYDSIAGVTCSGSIVVNLTKECWGTVNVCIPGKCGGVCSDTWTDWKSEMLCKDLGCGDNILPSLRQPTQGSVMFKSVHVSSLTGDFNRLSLITYKPNERTCDKTTAYIVCSGSVKPKFFSNDKCSGKVKVQYEDQWITICNYALTSSKTQDTICGELGCGRGFKMLDYFKLNSTESHVISNVICSANNNSLNTCKITTNRKSCVVGAIQCSNSAKIVLQTTIDTCSGAVYANSKENILSPVSAEGWRDVEGDRLCADLNCGKYMSMEKVESKSLINTSFYCNRAKPESIWDCEQQGNFTLAQQLYIKCQEPSVLLSQTCHGNVKIDGKEICDTNWNQNYSDLICQEMNCSNAIAVPSTNNMKQQNRKYHHVSCDKHTHRLGQCDRTEEKCDGGLVTVYCVRNVKFRTTEHCGGQIEVNYRHVWEKICPETKLFQDHKTSLCKLLDCTAHNASAKSNGKHQMVSLKTMLTCKKQHQDIRHCVKQHPCENSLPAEIFCNGYVQHIENQVVKHVSIGLGVLLILGFVAAVLVMLKMGKFPKMVSYSVKKKKKNVEEGDNGDDDNLGSKANEMEIFPHENINCERDESLLDYDDIDGAPEETQAEVHNSSETKAESSEAEAAGLVQWEDDYLVPGQD